MVMDWTVQENGLLHEDVESMPQIQLPDDINTSNTTDSSSNSANTSSHDDSLIRILQHEPTSRPRPSSNYLGFSVPSTLQSPDIFLQLTNISVTLENLARQLPSFLVHNTEVAGYDEISTANDSRRSGNTELVIDDNLEFGVGETYAITNKLVDIYIPLIEQTQQRKKTSGDVHDLSGRPMDEVDYPLLYLLFACHNRLVDLWRSMLIHRKAVLKSPRYSPDATGRVRARCAHFKMGSYEPSLSSSVVPMEVIVLQELANHLVKRIQDLIRVIDPEDAQSAAEDDGEAATRLQSIKAAVLSAKAVHQRALGMATEVSQLKSTLEEATTKTSSTT